MQQSLDVPPVPRRVALLVGVVTFVVALVALELEQRRFAERVSGGAPVVALVAARSLEPGAVLDAGALAEARVPSAYLDARRVLAKDRARVLGRPVTTVIEGGQALVWSDVATADGPTRLSLLVLPGRRAVQLPASVNALGALLRPRDRVDVLVAEATRAETLLENVLVLAVGAEVGSAEPRSGESGGERGRASAPKEGVTIDVSTREAESLLAAERRGALRLVLRHPADSGVAPREPKSPAPARHAVTKSQPVEIEHVR